MKIYLLNNNIYNIFFYNPLINVYFNLKKINYLYKKSDSLIIIVFELWMQLINFNIIKGEIKKGISIVKDNIMLTELERKLKKATANEHCHANVSLLNEISKRTAIREDYYIIYNHCMKKLFCRPEKWLKLLKFSKHTKKDDYKIKRLFDFSYLEGKADKSETSN